MSAHYNPYLDVTPAEALAFLVVTAVPALIAYFLGRHITPPWLGFLFSIGWLPLLLILGPRDARAVVAGAIIGSFLPIVIGFTVGIAKRPLKPDQ